MTYCIDASYSLLHKSVSCYHMLQRAALIMADREGGISGYENTRREASRLLKRATSIGSFSLHLANVCLLLVDTMKRDLLSCSP